MKWKRVTALGLFTCGLKNPLTVYTLSGLFCIRLELKNDCNLLTELKLFFVPFFRFFYFVYRQNYPIVREPPYYLIPEVKNQKRGQ